MVSSVVQRISYPELVKGYHSTTVATVQDSESYDIVPISDNCLSLPSYCHYSSLSFKLILFK